jgi:hypothetical protein
MIFIIIDIILPLPLLLRVLLLTVSTTTDYKQQTPEHFPFR